MRYHVFPVWVFVGVIFDNVAVGFGPPPPRPNRVIARGCRAGRVL